MANVSINMRVGGIAEVRKAFKSVRDIVKEQEQGMARDAQRLTELRVKLASKEKVELGKAAASVDKEWAKFALHRQKRDDRAADERAKGEKRANDEIKRDAQRTADHLHRIRLNSSRQAGRIAAQEVRDAEVAAKKRHRAMEGVLRTGVGAVGRGIGNVAGMGIRLAGAGMALGGGFTVADAVNRYMGAENASQNLSNSLRISTGKSYSNTALMKMATKMQGETGVGKEEMLKGWSSYLAKTGDSTPFDGDKEGTDTLRRVATLSKATGSDFGQMMDAAGMLRSQNSSLKGQSLTDMLYAITGQGGKGAIEVSDLAKVAGRVTSTATSYQGNQVDSQRRLLGLAQVAGGSFSPDEAATAVSRFAVDVGRHADTNKARGLNVMNDKGELSRPAEIVEQYFKATQGNLIKMGEGEGNLGLGAESMKIMQAVSGTYKNARDGGATNEDAARSVRKYIEELEGAKVDETTVTELHTAKMKLNSERLTAAMNRISEVVQSRAVPLLDRFASSMEHIDQAKIERVADAFGDLLGWLADNPWKGLGLVVVGSVTKELAGAGLGAAVNMAMSSAINGASPGMGGIIGGAIAAAIAGAAIGAGLSSYAESDGSEGAHSDTEAAEKTFANTQAARKLRKKVAGGEALTVDERNSLEKMKLGAMDERENAELNAYRVHSNKDRTWGETLVDTKDWIKGDPNRRDEAADVRVSTNEALLKELTEALQGNYMLRGRTSEAIPEPGGSGNPAASPLSGAQVVDAADLQKHVGNAIKAGIDDAVKNMAKPSIADPNSPLRSTAIGQRPTGA